jgi:hypothetical protein
MVSLADHSDRGILSREIERMAKTKTLPGTGSAKAALKLSGVGVTQTKQSNSDHLTLKFDEDTFCKISVRDGQKQSEVAARLRKLADQVESLRP